MINGTYLDISCNSDNTYILKDIYLTNTSLVSFSFWLKTMNINNLNGGLLNIVKNTMTSNTSIDAFSYSSLLDPFLSNIYSNAQVVFDLSANDR